GTEGRSMRVRLELWPVGGGPSACVLATAVGAQVLSAEPPPGPGDIDFEIALARDSFGVINVLAGPDPARRAASLVSQRCYRVLAGREEPCPGCPALPGADTLTRRMEDGTFRVVTAESVSAGTARIH